MRISYWSSAVCSSDLADAAIRRFAAAAVLGEIAHQGVHRGEVGRVDQRAPVTAKGHETGLSEPVQMKRQGRRRQAQPFPDTAHRTAFAPGLHQQPEYIEPGILGECRQGGYGS